MKNIASYLLLSAALVFAQANRPAEEAADAVRAFHPKVVYPYHYRGSDTEVFRKALDGTGIDVRLRNW